MRCNGSNQADRQIFFDLQLWPLISLQPLDQNQCLVPHLKDLFHICLETKAQGFWMTFKVCNHGSKYPYLLHKMGFVDSQFGTTVDQSRWLWGWWTVLKEDHEAGRKLKLKLSVKKLISQGDQDPIHMLWIKKLRILSKCTSGFRVSHYWKIMKNEIFMH